MFSNTRSLLPYFTSIIVFNSLLYSLGELLADCQAHDLFSDLSMYGRTYVEWKPTPAAKQTLRSNGTGLVMHRLMYPSVTINDPMIVQSVTITGNVYSANVTTDAYSLVGLKESDAPFLTVHLTLETVTTTSMVKVTPGLVDNGVDEIIMKLEIMGCPLTGK